MPVSRSPRHPDRSRDLLRESQHHPHRRPRRLAGRRWSSVRRRSPTTTTIRTSARPFSAIVSLGVRTTHSALRRCLQRTRQATRLEGGGERRRRLTPHGHRIRTTHRHHPPGVVGLAGALMPPSRAWRPNLDDCPGHPPGRSSPVAAENAGLLWRQTHAGEVTALPLHRFLGLRLREEAEPAAGVTLAVAEASSATTGLHGGVLGVVLDVAATLALMPLLSVQEVPAETVALISGAGPDRRRGPGAAPLPARRASVRRCPARGRADRRGPDHQIHQESVGPPLAAQRRTSSGDPPDRCSRWPWSGGQRPSMTSR